MPRNRLILNRYRPIAEAGAGGFGTVQVAWDTRIQRKVAIKCIALDEGDALSRRSADGEAARPDGGEAWGGGFPLPAEEAGFSAADDDAGALQEGDGCNAVDDDGLSPLHSGARIPGLGEARTAALLSDPNIVAVYDFEVQGRTAYLIMECIEGLTLAELLSRHGDKLTLDMAAAVVTSVAHALEVAHDNQVLHLDIKPDNILINRQGQVKVTDFGLATLADASGFGPAGGGTIGYMPPEQMRGESLDARCDEWALASVAYEMLTGKNPFLADDLQAAEEAIEDAELVLPSLCRDDLDAAADDVLFYALDPDREERYDNVADFVEELEKFLGDPRRGHRQLAVLVGDAQADDEEDAVRQEAPRKPRLPLYARVGALPRNVAARAVGALGSAGVAFAGLSNLPQASGLDNPLFWGLLALTALAGALKTHLGALLSYVVLAAALIARGAPAVGCALLAAVAAWWFFAGRKSGAGAGAVFAVPLAGAVGASQLAPFAAGFCLPPARALATTLFSLFAGAVFASFGTGNLLGWDAPAHLLFAGDAVQARMGGILLQPATWSMAVGWLAAAGALSVLRRRPTRAFSLVGVALAMALLLAGCCATAWIASGGATAAPSVGAVAPTLLSAAATALFAALIPPASAFEDEDGLADAAHARSDG